MKQQEVFKKIGGIIKELSDQYEYLKTADEPLNDLELELFLANSHFLTDHMIILSKLNAQAAAQKDAGRDEKKPEPVQPKKSTPTELPGNSGEPKYFEPLVQPKAIPAINDVLTPEIKIEEDVQPEPENITVNEIHPVSHIEPETIRHELIIDEADLDEGDDISVAVPVKKEEPAEIKPEPKPAPAVAKEEPAPVAEKPAPQPAPKPEPQQVKEPEKEEIQTLNERMSARFGERNGMADQLHSQPITDLKAAINMNDKLLYVKDLFNGYSLAYSEAIEILNRFSSFDEADLFLKKNYTVKNNWEGKTETTAKFYALLRRRYV